MSESEVGDTTNSTTTLSDKHKEKVLYEEKCKPTAYGILQLSQPVPVSIPPESEEEEQEVSKKVERKKLTEILNRINNVKTWVEGGTTWTQTVLSEPPTREEVAGLADRIDRAVIENNARESGICDIRSAIYSELFDEVIRQEAVNCLERGRLLVEVRDELRLTLDEYKSLYCSSLAYALRKATQAQKIHDEFESDKQLLSSKLESYQEEIANLDKQMGLTEKRYEELSKLNAEKHALVAENLRESNKILKEKLVSFIAPKK